MAGRKSWCPDDRCRIAGRRHRQTDHDACPFVESPRGENGEWVHVFHLATGLRIAINPNHVAPSLGAAAPSRWPAPRLPASLLIP